MLTMNGVYVSCENIKEANTPRKNWDKAFQKMRANKDDSLFFADNKADFEWEWE